MIKKTGKLSSWVDIFWYRLSERIAKEVKAVVGIIATAIEAF